MTLATKIEWAPAAKRDASEIWERYFAISSVEMADHMLDELERTALMIAEHPRALRERPDIMRGIHVARCQPYLLLYRLQGDSAAIVRILHERRDVPLALANEDQ